MGRGALCPIAAAVDVLWQDSNGVLGEPWGKESTGLCEVPVKMTLGRHLQGKKSQIGEWGSWPCCCQNSSLPHHPIFPVRVPGKLHLRVKSSSAGDGRPRTQVEGILRGRMSWPSQRRTQSEGKGLIPVGRSWGVRGGGCSVRKLDHGALLCICECMNV